jgi:ankyrin repeat protein
MGADVATKDEDEGITVLYMAAVEGHEAVVRLLLEMGANVARKDKSGMTALQFAVGEGYEVVV